jgi:hypothetical protein
LSLFGFFPYLAFTLVDYLVNVNRYGANEYLTRSTY